MTVRTKQLSRDECNVELQLMVDSALAKYGTHAYTYRYMQSLLATTLALVPRRDQEVLITTIRTCSDLLCT